MYVSEPLLLASCEADFGFQSFSLPRCILAWSLVFVSVALSCYVLSCATLTARDGTSVGLPLIVYRSTVLHATTPSKRKAGTRPRTFNFYCTGQLPGSLLQSLIICVILDWLPNHLIVLFVGFTFALLNPLVIPFQLFYFSIILGECRSYVQFTTID